MSGCDLDEFLHFIRFLFKFLYKTNVQFYLDYFFCCSSLFKFLCKTNVQFDLDYFFCWITTPSSSFALVPIPDIVAVSAVMNVGIESILSKLMCTIIFIVFTTSYLKNCIRKHLRDHLIFKMLLPFFDNTFDSLRGCLESMSVNIYNIIYRIWPWRIQLVEPTFDFTRPKQ